MLNAVDGAPQLAHFRCPSQLLGLVLRYRVIIQGRIVFDREIVRDGGGKWCVCKTDVIVSRRVLRQFLSKKPVLLDGGDRHNLVGESRLGEHHLVLTRKNAGLMYFHFIANAEIG